MAGGAAFAEEGKASEEERLPPGFRFHPTDEELITYYLTHKIKEANFSPRAITEVDLNKCEPWDLPGKAKMGEKEWYFFSLRDRKYPTGVRTNRATSAGYWKTTGKDKEIFNSSSNGTDHQLVGMKKTLVFYKGRAPRGEKTNWVMHEYRLHSKLSSYKGNKLQDEWVVCRVFMKTSSGKKFSSSQPRSSSSSNPYQLDMASAAAAAAVAFPSLISTDHLSAGGNNYFGIGRQHILANMINPINLMDLPRSTFPRPSHAGFMNLSAVLPQLNYPGGGGGFSRLNLNLEAPTPPPPPQQPGATAGLRSFPFPLTSSQPQIPSSVLPNCLMDGRGGGGFGMEAAVSSSTIAAPRYQGIESAGMELEGYWPQLWKE